jgi:hypothetical protein
MAFEHFASDLRIARLIGANESKGTQPKKEKQDADAGDEREIEPAAPQFHDQSATGARRVIAQMLMSTHANSRTTKPSLKGNNAT